MRLFKNFVSQTRKPEGFLGQMMVNGMNSGHAEIEGALKDAGFSAIKTDHHESKPWITVIAEK
ncbi:hypothetical protein [Pseudobutyrivibrio xylanivorans]|uniref:Methyltransferase n=1 Tax=Pseudobutyrivibrio xylanivorans TaxID=185007 RepID=A0A5P6VLS5_PSEXY|nr:hypothetical protein [Pseudobutyrivibrio xylanivorans]QFJ53517.1 hypothetical protein FXF36_00845 [Pseudobutyrivibrio xylanivorans]